MNISTLFNLGDKVYAVEDSNKGKLVPLVVEKINIVVETTSLNTISYQISSTSKYHNTSYFESELEVYSNAKIRAESKLNNTIAEIQKEILDL